MRTIYYSTYASPIGLLLLGVSDRGLAYLEFARRGNTAKKRPGWVESEEKTAPYREQLDGYFRGELKEFDIPLDLEGTEFQKRCWNALLRIPYGKTRSYAEIARAVGSPRGFRAVGMANHDNPVAIVVPCHRVITSDGKLGGYGGGLDVKEKLLKLEGAWNGQAELFGSTHRHRSPKTKSSAREAAHQSRLSS
ncbi:MAG TPA: methylated-DNA--[protein]-cysteine S-methyltransferase [Terriglobales bacterium]|nr:methylated-DNA--[protein]-cysteine S-methyltransferase [Terriglobales bacterium]